MRLILIAGVIGAALSPAAALAGCFVACVTVHSNGTISATDNSGNSVSVGPTGVSATTVGGGQVSVGAGGITAQAPDPKKIISDAEHQVNDLANRTQDIAKQAVQASDEVAKAGVDASQQTINNARDAANTANSLVDQAQKAADQAGTDVAKASLKAVQDAAKAAGDALQKINVALATVASQAGELAAKAADQGKKQADHAVEEASALAVNAAATAARAARDAAREAQKQADVAKTAADKIGTEAARQAANAAQGVAQSAAQLADNANKAVVKAGQDVAWNLAKSGGDIVDAGKAAAEFAADQAKGTLKTLDSAEKRIKEGKFVDAVWEASMDNLRNTDSDMATAMQRSSVLKDAAAAAATAYGGPAGAAAFAAWSTYHETGNADLALRVGILSAISYEGGAIANEMPSGSFDEVIKKAATSGAIAGLSVAAAGGNEKAVAAAFLQASQTVVVQAVQQPLTDATADLQQRVKAAIQENGLCVNASADNCLPTIQTTQGLANWGADEVGVPQPTKDQIAAVAGSISKIPDTHAIALFHDQWALSWNPDALKGLSSATATVVTEIGEGSDFYSDLQKKVKDGSALVYPTEQLSSK